MKYLKIIFLHFEHVFENRMRSFIWFLIPLMNNAILIIFWQGSVIQGSTWNMSSITSYYFLMTITGALLTSHVEKEIAEYDIMEGDLVRYLTRPFSYYLSKLIEEFPWRVLQGLFAVILFAVFLIFFHTKVTLDSSLIHLPFLLLILFLAYLIAYTIKMSLGLTTFWFKENGGLFELFTMANIILSGGIVPLNLEPTFIRNLSYALPFSYTGYFPIIALQGKLDLIGLLQVVSIQCFWLVGLLFLNRMIWKNGLKVFAAVGQ